MKMKVANYIAEFLVQHGIKMVFTVTGGGAMHLNDAFGHHPKLRCIYNHHEQACAIAAESYARINNKIALVCVTSGPGGTNAITGVVGGWLDSIPMLIISGQVRYDTTARSTGLKLRAMGDQEFDISQAVSCMTKYCEMITDPNRIRYCLEKSLHLALTGRPGPCWLDIPLNVQGAYIETQKLFGFDICEDDIIVPPIDDAVVECVLQKLKMAKRPIFYTGNGIRLSGGYSAFCRVVNKLNIPVVTEWNGIDILPDEHPLYVGRAGIMGNRAGNFAVQNSDCILSIGSRLSIRQVGYEYKTWAKDAFVIMNDIDKAELQKPTLHIDIPIWGDAKALLEALDQHIGDGRFSFSTDWQELCTYWKQKYPVVSATQYEQTGKINVYVFIKSLSERLSEGQVIVVGNGSACVVGSQAFVIKKGQRFIVNSAIASMGYDLPAAIGAQIASGSNEVICITGDGSIQMNIQELATLSHNQLPIKIFVINNGGYHSIRQTQRNYFEGVLIGVGEESGDISFPNLQKLAAAYDLPYYRMDDNQKICTDIESLLSSKAPLICEVFVDKKQNFEPKVTARKMLDGRIVSSPLEDMSPFLSREELNANMVYRHF